MSSTFAALGEFGDAISFIFSARENQRGAPVGGAHNLPLLWEHLKLCAAAMGLALAIALPLGLDPRPHGQGLVPGDQRRPTSVAPCRASR